jgi:energy-coupling factor transporter ATP-binding protein EcfA2
VRDVYFGIHIGAGSQAIVRDNVIAPGTARGARPGHGISAWNLTDSAISGNRISDARDGIYLSFHQPPHRLGHVVTRSRYGLHSMYSQQAAFEGNTASGNLLGAALMMSDRLVLRGNRIERHREGAAAYGVLLKDIGELVADGNLIAGNRIGIYAEGVSPQPGREALVARNVIAGNEVGLALQRTAALTLTGNRIADNLTDVRALGRELSPAMQWSRDGRGNFWGQYRGYDADGDGIGDVPYALHDAMDAGDPPRAVGAGVPLHTGPSRHRGGGADVPAVPAGAGAGRRPSADDGPHERCTMIEIHERHQALRPPRRALPACATAASGRDHVLLGANGAGKSTLLRCLLGVDRLRGPNRVAGLDPICRRTGGSRAGRLHAAERRAAPRSHGRRHDGASTPPSGAPARRGSVLLDEAGSRHRARPVRRAVRRMRQRLGFAIALLTDPPILVLDEPTPVSTREAARGCCSACARRRRRTRS